jgi:hypothetical protein
MIPVTSAIVAHGNREFGNVFTDIFNAHVFGISSGDGIVQIGNVGLMVFAMVNFHGACIDMWFERVEIVGRGASVKAIFLCF